MGRNNSAAHVVEVSTPDVQQKDDTGRRPSAPAMMSGQPNYPTSTTPRSIHDRRRFEVHTIVLNSRLQSVCLHML